MLLSFGVSLVLVVFLLCAAFRPSIIVIGVFVATLFAALAWTLWLAYLLYGTLNIVTSIVAAMLVGLFVDYNIHVYQRFWESYRAEREDGAGPGDDAHRNREGDSQRGAHHGVVLFFCGRYQLSRDARIGGRGGVRGARCVCWRLSCS